MERMTGREAAESEKSHRDRRIDVLGELTHLLFQPHAPDDSKAYLRLRELKAICRATNMPKLTHLALRFTDFGDAGVKELLASGILKRLKVLDLNGGCVTDDGAKLLAASPDVKKLELLNLDINALHAALRVQIAPADVTRFLSTRVWTGGDKARTLL